LQARKAHVESRVAQTLMPLVPCFARDCAAHAEQVAAAEAAHLPLPAQPPGVDLPACARLVAALFDGDPEDEDAACPTLDMVLRSAEMRADCLKGLLDR